MVGKLIKIHPTCDNIILCKMLHFDILDDLSDDLGVCDFYRFLSINDLVYELSYRITRRVEYYYDVHRWITLHEVSCSNQHICACIRITTVTECACFCGDLEVLKWFFFNKRDLFDGNYIGHAVAGGNLEVVKWLYEVVGNKLTGSDMIYASANNSIDIAEWLYDNGWKGDVGSSLDWAAHNGHLEMVQWLVRNYGEDIEMAFSSARMYRRLDIAEWIIKNTNYECTDDQLVWLRDNNIKIDE